MKEITLRKDIINSFKKYCRQCDAPCCTSKDFAIFNWELKNLPLGGKGLVTGKYKNYEKKLVKYVLIREKCYYLKNKGCELKLNARPIDCLSYPIYPIIKNCKNNSSKIVGMMVHKSCPFCVDISKDRKLMKVMEIFWNKKIRHISKDEMRDWFGDMRNYWSKENRINFSI